jgi:hypothetical protein
MWGGEPGRDDIAALQRELECSLSDEEAFAIVKLVWAYWRTTVSVEEGVPRSALQKRLLKLARSSGTTARLLAAKEWDFEELAPIMAHREKYPHDRLDWETHTALTEELELLWGRLKEKFPGAPKLFQLELLELAHTLAVVSNAANAAAQRIGSGDPGRPEGGSKDLIVGLISVFEDAGQKITCYVDPVTSERKGNVLKLIAWLKESADTLFDHARRRSRQKGKKPSAA